MSRNHHPLENTVDMVCHGRHVVRYIQDWQDQKVQLDKFLRSLIKHLDRFGLNLLTQAEKDQGDLQVLFQDPLEMALIYLLAASKHQELVCHLQRVDSVEAQELATNQRQRVQELLRKVHNLYHEYVDTHLVQLWIAANKDLYAGPEHAP